MLGNPNTSQGEKSLEDTEKRESRGGGWEVGAQVALGEWQAQGLGDSAGGLEAGVGAPRGAQPRRLSEMTLLISRRESLAGARSMGDGNMCCGSALPWAVPPGLRLPRQLSLCPRASGSFGAPCIVLSGKPEGQNSGQSSAPDTRWLRGSVRFFWRSAGVLSPPRWWALLCLSSAGAAGSPGGRAQGHGTAPGLVLPGTSSQARRG